MQKQEHVVIKRGGHKHEEEIHGGAWKVAFADFMIALMALFLVLWIMQVVNKNERKAIVASLQTASLFGEGSGGNPFDTSRSLNPIDLSTDSSVRSKDNNTHTVTSNFNGNGEGPESDALVEGTYDTQAQLEALAKVIKSTVNKIHAQDNVKVTVTPQGLRIVLQDDYKQNMFSRGGTDLTPFFQDLLLAFAPVFQKVKNPVVISGHTDATHYRNNAERSNWELSASRANVARRTLVAGGMPTDRVLQVAGMSDRMLLDKDDPESSANRRIELFILTTPAANTLKTLFGHSPDSALEQAKAKAKFNEPVLRQPSVGYQMDSSTANSAQ